MANPTTNYGWPMPTATDLVTDLPADFAAFGQPVDTSLKALNPGTTLGDLAYSSATANTNTRLGIGTTGQVLSVSGGVPAWATVASGGMTLISSTALSGATVTLSSIPQTYKNLQLVFRDHYGSFSGGSPQVRFNADSTANYQYYIYSSSGGTAISSNTATKILLNIDTAGSDAYDNADRDNSATVDIYDYTTTTKKNGFATSTFVNNTGTTTIVAASNFGYKGTSAITSIVLNWNAGSFSGGTVLLYGVN